MRSRVCAVNKLQGGKGQDQVRNIRVCQLNTCEKISMMNYNEQTLMKIGRTKFLSYGNTGFLKLRVMSVRIRLE